MLIKVDGVFLKKVLLVVEFLACFGLLLVIYGLGVLIALAYLFSLQFYAFSLLLILLISGGLGLMGITSMLMELLVSEVQLPRTMQSTFTAIGILVAVAAFLWSYKQRGLDWYALVFVAPIACALHFAISLKAVDSSERKLG
ncbi:MAG: hypothetical protein R3F50_02640 [Gammaproteobacteria bacterium]|jgi:hypothetical protein